MCRKDSLSDRGLSLQTYQKTNRQKQTWNVYLHINWCIMLLEDTCRAGLSFFFAGRHSIFALVPHSMWMWTEAQDHLTLWLHISTCAVVNWGETRLMKRWQAVILVDEFTWIRFASLGIKTWSLFRGSVALMGFSDWRSKRTNKHLVRTYFVIIAAWGLQRHSKRCVMQDTVNFWTDTF